MSSDFLSELDDMESAFEQRAARSVQQRPKSAGSIRRPVTSLSEIRSQRAPQDKPKSGSHTASLSALAEIRKRTADKLRGGRSTLSTSAKPAPSSSGLASPAPSTTRGRTRNNTATEASVPKPAAERPARRAPAFVDRPATGLQRPKTAGATRRTPRQSVENEPQLSRREQIALKKERQAALLVGNRRGATKTKASSRDASPANLSQSTVARTTQRPRSASAARRLSSSSGAPGRGTTRTAGDQARTSELSTADLEDPRQEGDARKAEEAAARKKAAEERTAKRKAAEDAAAKKRADEAAARKEKADEAAARKKAAEEAAAKKKADAAAARTEKAEEAAARKKTSEEAAAKKAEEAAAKKAAEEEAAAKKKTDEEEAAKKAADAKKAVEEEEANKKREEEEEAAAKRAAEEEAAAKQAAEEEDAGKNNQEEAAAPPAEEEATDEEPVDEVAATEEPAAEPPASAQEEPAPQEPVPQVADHKPDEPIQGEPEEEADAPPQLVANEPPATCPDEASPATAKPDEPTAQPAAPAEEDSKKSEDVIGHLMTKDLDPRKAELLRQAQARVMEKRKSMGGKTPDANITASPSAAKGDASGAKPTWQQKLDAALARRRAEASKAADGSAESEDLQQKISDQIDNRINELRASRRAGAEVHNSAEASTE
eukprot:TRINITY_DN5139_c0_g2_i1.p1 TRINITY_DN5139_c0_g2~~TRINITY_DN5139_c0_g2_i1.p1  ORF type:complete len:661 (+),score=195.06 TRINITY_DN5139_c0_g2_i1:229-2211(+)